VGAKAEWPSNSNNCFMDRRNRFALGGNFRGNPSGSASNPLADVYIPGIGYSSRNFAVALSFAPQISGGVGNAGRVARLSAGICRRMAGGITSAHEFVVGGREPATLARIGGKSAGECSASSRATTEIGRLSPAEPPRAAEAPQRAATEIRVSGPTVWRAPAGPPLPRLDLYSP